MEVWIDPWENGHFAKFPMLIQHPWPSLSRMVLPMLTEEKVSMDNKCKFWSWKKAVRCSHHPACRWRAKSKPLLIFHGKGMHISISARVWYDQQVVAAFQVEEGCMWRRDAASGWCVHSTKYSGDVDFWSASMGLRTTQLKIKSSQATRSFRGLGHLEHYTAWLLT